MKKKEKVRWYKPTLTEATGWEKDQPPAERRRLMLEAHGGDLLSTARALRALANVTQDKSTKRAAALDATYFYKEYSSWKEAK